LLCYLIIRHIFEVSNARYSGLSLGELSWRVNREDITKWNLTWWLAGFLDRLQCSRHRRRSQVTSRFSIWNGCRAAVIANRNRDARKIIDGAHQSIEFRFNSDRLIVAVCRIASVRRPTLLINWLQLGRAVLDDGTMIKSRWIAVHQSIVSRKNDWTNSWEHETIICKLVERWSL